MRLVLDSNVIIAAFVTRGLCHALFEYCLETHKVIVCEEILGEVRAALLGKIKVPEEVVGQIDSYLRSSAELVRGAAVSSGAAYLITGYGELVMLRKVEDPSIVSPRTFWRR
jgi:predicted nucleic acid-binding protein